MNKYSTLWINTLRQGYENKVLLKIDFIDHNVYLAELEVLVVVV